MNYRILRLSGPELVMVGALILDETERLADRIGRADAQALEDQARQLKASAPSFRGSWPT